MRECNPHRRLVKERFLSKVNKTDGCWLWTASKRGTSGYGGFKVDGKRMLAHRVSYELFINKIQNGLQVCHSCDNRLCVNPEHLFLGTQSDNMIDWYKKWKAKGVPKKYKTRIRLHGTMMKYEYDKCKCVLCRRANAERVRKQRLKQTAQF